MTLGSFYKKLNRSDYNLRAVTKSAFSQARSKLNPECFKRLNQVACKAFYTHNEVYTWYGIRVLAIDGSRLMLPNHQTVREELGVHGFGPKAGSNRSVAICSMLYDVLNRCADSPIQIQ